MHVPALALATFFFFYSQSVAFQITFYDNTDVSTVPDEAFPMIFSSNSSSSGVVGFVGDGTPGFLNSRTINQISFVFAMGNGDASDFSYLRIGNSIEPMQYDGVDHFNSGQVGNYGNLSWEIQRHSSTLEIEKIAEFNNTPVYCCVVNGVDYQLDSREEFNVVFAARSSNGGVAPLMMLNDKMINNEMVDNLGFYKLLSDNTQHISNFSFLSGDNTAIMFSVKGSVNTLLGDINLDGEVNLLDVAPFVELLASGEIQAEADCNQDGVVNLLDVDPFIAILSGG